VLGDQEIGAGVDPLPECRERRDGAGRQARAGLGAYLDLVTVEGDDQIRPSREAAVDRPHPDARSGRDLTDRRVTPEVANTAAAAASSLCRLRCASARLLRAGTFPEGPAVATTLSFRCPLTKRNAVPYVNRNNDPLQPG
jgi:hypothetical protein